MIPLLLVLVPLLTPPQDVPPADTHLPPEVGDVAPGWGHVLWRQAPGGAAPDLQALRGEVVLVQTWIWYCDSCVREGVPLVVDLAKAHPDDLVAISLHGQNQREDVADDHWLSVGREMGMGHALGETSYFGEFSPWFNLNHTGGTTTWCFVIGREGGVVWKGDPSVDRDGFLEAVAAALARPAAPPLDDAPVEPLREAYRAYVLGDWAAAGRAAEKAGERFAKRRRDPELSAAAVAQAEALAARVTRQREALTARLEQAFAERDPEAFLRAARAIEAGFAKDDLAGRAGALRREAQADADFADVLEAWETWLQLEEERPALFPARADREGKRYATRLEKHLKRDPDGPGAARARGWLEAFAAE